MFRIMERLKVMALAMPNRSPFTSVIPALSIATSVPVPIAMPTLAAASAGASLMPSPAITTVSPASRSARMRASFDAGVAPAADGPGGGFLDRIGNRNEACGTPIHRDEDHGASPLLQRAGIFQKIGIE